MSSTAQTILQQALQLGERDRADIASQLLASLDDGTDEDPEVVGRVWADELADRADRYFDGGEQGEELSTVMTRLKADLKQR